ncbi:MAG: FAD-dependent oxidoreductase [Bacteroidota bacterium]
MENKIIWAEGLSKPAFEPLKEDLEIDYLVVGGGITGLTLALKLRRKGLRVALVEAREIAAGDTGVSTGFVTVSVDAGYAHTASKIGEYEAKALAESTQMALRELRTLLLTEDINAGEETLSAYYFGEQTTDAAEISEEYRASVKYGLDCKIGACDLPFFTSGALEYPDQLAINPVQYAYSIAALLQRLHVPVYENTRITDWRESNGKVYLEAGKVRIEAKKVAFATHVPPGFSTTQLMAYPYRSYVMGFSINTHVPKCMFFDTADPYHYIRSVEHQGKTLLICGGADHKTGQANEIQSFRDIETYIRNRFDVREIKYKWSGQYYRSADGLPVIGPSSENIYIATAFDGDGLTYGIMAACILAEQLSGAAYAYEDIFAPGRSNLRAGLTTALKENINVAWHFVKDRLSVPEGRENEIPAGEGRLMKIDDHTLAVYRRPDGEFIALSPKCSHLGCTVQWNNAEKTWDCPCHGGRYSCEGKVLEGPPLKNLEKAKLHHFSD